MTLVRRFALIILLTLAFLLPRQSAPAASETDPIANLDAFITKALKEYQVPGAAVAVVQNGKTVLLKGYGVRDVTKSGAVDENTIFQLASVTKTLTGAAAATVVDEGKLDWDTPIFNYLPEFVGYNPYMTRFMTERDLLAQRTGWPAYTGDVLDSFGYDRAEILRRLRFFKPRYSLREVAQYSNPGFLSPVRLPQPRRSTHGMISSKRACSNPWRCRDPGRGRKICKMPTQPQRTRWLTARLSSSSQQSSTPLARPAPLRPLPRTCRN
jgi:CubicO group peptidase (beta-lactamase class C family)